MKARMVLCLFIVVLIASFASRSMAQVTTHGDTTFITGGTFAGGENAGVIDSVISNDTTAAGARKNPNAIYALYEGQVYYQLTPMYFYNPSGGPLTIIGVPNPATPTKTAKPIILLQPTGTTDVPANKVYGSIRIENVHWQVMELDGNLQAELFYCGTANKQPQSLVLNNDLFEYSSIDIFDCTNETGAIGGWPYGAKFKITNCYFRNMFEPSQWWSSRVFQCKHPMDTLWVENVTTTTGGLTFLQQNELTDFAYFNHNTIINNKKYWLLSPYHRSFFVTNNIFVNQNWVGEDTNVTNSGQDPDKLFMSTVNVDTNNTTNGLIVNARFETQTGNDTSNFSSLLNLANLQVYVSNNVVFNDPLLTSGYYTNSTYVLADTGATGSTGAFNAIPSYLGWFYPGARPVHNIPGEWENSRTAALIAAYGKGNGGMIEEGNWTPTTAPVAYGMSAGEVTAMAQWNQHQYSDSRFSVPAPVLTSTAYIYGDYDPTTLPGIVGGSKTDAISQSTTLAAGDQVGISKFTDLTENFSQSTYTSRIDGFPVGSLIWNDTQNAAYAAAWSGEWWKVYDAYIINGGITAVKATSSVATTFALSQNYPNPFNPSTQIDFSIPQQSNVELKVYNTLGQLVATLVNGNLSAGSHSVTFDASRLASGMYIYRLSAGNFTSVKKMLLLK